MSITPAQAERGESRLHLAASALWQIGRETDNLQPRFDPLSWRWNLHRFPGGVGEFADVAWCKVASDLIRYGVSDVLHAGQDTSLALDLCSERVATDAAFMDGQQQARQHLRDLLHGDWGADGWGITRLERATGEWRLTLAPWGGPGGLERGIVDAVLRSGTIARLDLHQHPGELPRVELIVCDTGLWYTHEDAGLGCPGDEQDPDRQSLEDTMRADCKPDPKTFTDEVDYTPPCPDTTSMSYADAFRAAKYNLIREGQRQHDLAFEFELKAQEAHARAHRAFSQVNEGFPVPGDEDMLSQG